MIMAEYAIEQFIEYAIETPIAQPPIVEMYETVNISTRITSTTTTYSAVEIEILDILNSPIQSRTWRGYFYAGIPQTIGFDFVAEPSPNNLYSDVYRHVTIRITDDMGTIERTFSNIFEIGTGLPSATASDPVNAPNPTIVGQSFLITSLIAVTHPGTYVVTINVWEGGLFGQSTTKMFWSKSQQVTFTFAGQNRYVSAGGVETTYDGDNLTRSVEIIIYSDGVEIFKDDWNENRYDVIESDIYVDAPIADHATRYIGEPQRIMVSMAISFAGTYKVFIDVHEGGIAGPGRWMWGDEDSGGQMVTFSALQSKWVSISGNCITYDGDNGTRDVVVRLYDTGGNEVYRSTDFGNNGKFHDIYNVVKYKLDFETQDYYPQADPVFVPIGDTVRITTRLKASYPGQYKFVFMLYEEAFWGKGEELYPPIEVDQYFNADEWTDVIFDHVCTLPVRVRESTGVDIHLDVYDEYDNKKDIPAYPRVFDIGLGAAGVKFEVQEPYPIAVPRDVWVGDTVEITTRIKAPLEGQYRFVFFLKEEALFGVGPNLWPPIEVEAYLNAGVFTDVVFDHVCTMPSIGESTGVDIHIDIYSGAEKLDDLQFGNRFDIFVEVPPPEYDLIQHTIYPYAYIYTGDVEVTTATFKTDPFTPAAWMADKFASKLEDEVRARGGRPLELKVYVDKSPLFWTNFRIEVVGTPLGAEVASGIAVGIPIWLAIILVCLAIIAVIIVATLAIKTIVGLFTTYPGLHDVKPGWGKETLILAIQDSEDFWERPLTPLATLEGMSEADLRDYLDQIAEEEVKPEVAWLPLAIVGGLVVLGVGAAVALTARRE
ncbi:hypothetical protein ES703_74966 [subsurface metagenome]